MIRLGARGRCHVHCHFERHGRPPLRRSAGSTAPVAALLLAWLTLAASFARLASPPARPRLALNTAQSAYIHIPFCKQRCYYCDFPISVVGADTQRPGARTAIDRYLDALAIELDRGGGGALTPKRPCPDVGAALETIYLGGGTPSLLEPQEVDRILRALDERFGIAPGAEISMEMDPGTFDLAKAQGMRAAGVNRVSMGVQSFAEEQLKACGRGHGVSEVEEGVGFLRQAGFQELSLDIMSGLPGDTVQGLERSLQRAVALEPTHLSVYDLIVEEGTAFWRWYGAAGEDGPRRGPRDSSTPGQGGGGGGAGWGSQVRDLPSDELAGEMYCAANRFLASHGFEHYEISSYARLPPGAAPAGGEDDGARSPHRSRHNMVYWKHDPFLAFGMGATSFVGGVRLARPRSLDAYGQWIQQGGPSTGLVGQSEDEEDEEEVDQAWSDLVEVLMVGLRMRHGLVLQDLRRQYGDALVERALSCFAPHVGAGLVEITPGGRLRLSSPQVLFI